MVEIIRQTFTLQGSCTANHLDAPNRAAGYLNRTLPAVAVSYFGMHSVLPEAAAVLPTLRFSLVRGRERAALAHPHTDG